MEELIEGVDHFQNKTFPTMEDLFVGLVKKGQHPKTLFITCSDSRIDPNLLTRTQPGELFVVRNAGNIVPPHGAANGGEAGTIEYAVAALGVTHIVVCGHSHCGAMDGLLHPEKVAALPAVSAWLSHAEATRRIMADHYADLCGAALLTKAVEQNVLVQLENLGTLPSVASRLKMEGDLKLYLHGWVYEIETGKVSAYDAAKGEFVELTVPSGGAAERQNVGDN